MTPTAFSFPAEVVSNCCQLQSVLCSARTSNHHFGFGPCQNPIPILLQILPTPSTSPHYDQSWSTALDGGLTSSMVRHLRQFHFFSISCPAAAGLLVFSAILYAKMLAIPLVVSYHTHIPEYIPKYTWKGLVEPMWKLIRFCTLMADVTLVPSRAMKVPVSPPSFQQLACRHSSSRCEEGGGPWGYAITHLCNILQK